MSNTSIEFPVTVTNDTCLIQLPEHLTVVEAVALDQQLQHLMQESPKQIVLDMGYTTFIDSSGIGSLVKGLRKAQAQQIDFVLWGVQLPVQLTFSMIGLEKAFKIEAGTEAVLPIADAKTVQRLPTHPSMQSKIKRVLDIVGALVGLSITAIVLIPIAIAIKLDNPGAIFFCQTRCGLMGKQFRLWKFRSMVQNAEALKMQVKNQVDGPMFKNANDPRITRVGRFLRRTSLDELPQFWNVLRGDMSLVGTRPPTPDELEQYEVPNWQRLNVKPGMTGEWQVYGRSQVCSFEDVIALDLRYQERWSLGYDLKLIWKTIAIVFTKNSGAY